MNSKLLIAYFERFIRAFLTFVITSMVAHKFGADNFGVLSIWLSIASIMGAFFSLGLIDTAQNNFLKSDGNNILFSEITYIYILSNLIGFIIFVFLSFKLNLEREVRLCAIFSIFCNVFYFWKIIEQYFFSLGQNDKFGKVSIASLFVSFAAKIFILFSPLSPWYIAALFPALDGLIVFIILLYLKLIKFRLISVTHRKTKIRNIIKESLPFVIIGLATIFYMRIDVIMLGWFVSNTNVGQYALAARIMEAANFIPLILATYLFKFISNANLNSLKSFILIIRSYSFIFFWLGVITSLSLIIFSYYYFNMLEKNGFSFSLLLSTLLYPSFIFVSLGTFIGKLLLIKSLQQYIVYATITGAFINILLNLILIPTFGIFGAALSTIISYMISGLLFFIFFDKTRFVVVEMFKGVLLYQKSDKSYGK